jgi:hypothetical protein
MMLQPNAGALIEQHARDQALQARRAMATAAEQEQEHKNDSRASTSSASSSSSSSSSAAVSLAVASNDDSFLRPQPSVDSFLTPASSDGAGDELEGDLWSRLSSLVLEDSFAASLPPGALALLKKVSTLDTRRTFSKSSALARLPRALCLHLNRLDGSSMSGKRTQHVAFPPRLDMARFTASKGRQQDLQTNMQLSEAPGRNADKSRQLQLDRMRGSNGGATSSIYELDAVVVHLGSSGSSGHYVAYRRQLQPGSPASAATWWHVSDEARTQVSLNSVLAAQAYLLLYTAVEPRP